MKNEAPKSHTDLKEILDNLPEDKKEKTLEAIWEMSIENSYSGPIPRPQDMEQYNAAIPHGADRIMTMAEKQLNHRIEVEQHAVKSGLNLQRKGQICGFILAFICIAGGIVLGFYDKTTIAVTLVTSTITALLAAFVMGKNKTPEDPDTPQ